MMDTYGIYRVFRTKTVNVDTIQDTELRRCLGVFELTTLGIGSTLGAGIYVLTGQVAKDQAGPSVVLSFVLAAIASLFAALCYAEFAARVPKAGSAYVYSYVSVGEIWAFIIGWNMILESIIGSASVGRAWSQYLDALGNDTIRRSFLKNVGGMHVPGLAEYPDFIALILVALATIVVATGVKMSSIVNTVFTLLNGVVILTVIGVGLFYVDKRNWTDPPGFFPFGVKGVLSGAATCFYAFVGFDTIATSGEEARNPSKSIPLAIMLTLGVSFIAYFGVSTVLTMMVPWNMLAETAPLPKAFATRGIAIVPYIVNIGGMFGLAASMMGSIFPLPRTMYSMAQDGLIFNCFSYIHPKTHTPLISAIVAGFLTALFAMFLDLDSLVQMMSIGTLMAYSMVAASVIVLRYQPENVGLSKDNQYEDLHMPREMSELSEGTVSKLDEQQNSSEETGILTSDVGRKLINYVPSNETTVFRRLGSESDEVQSENDKRDLIVEEKKIRVPVAHQSQKAGNTYQKLDRMSEYSLQSLFNVGDGAAPEPTERTKKISIISLLAICFLLVCLCCLTVYGLPKLLAGEWWAVLLCCLLVILILCFVAFLARQPKNSSRLIFKVPFVPLVPLMSLVFNMYLMVTLSTATWIRFGVWLAIGLAIYFGYGIRHSREKQYRRSDSDIAYYSVNDPDE